jgi:hypothetical protein
MRTIVGAGVLGLRAAPDASREVPWNEMKRSS